MVDVKYYGLTAGEDVWYALKLSEEDRTRALDALVTHAHWMYRFDTGIYQTEFLCSRCSRPARTLTACKLEDVDYEYCPHCMAKMDEEA